MSKKASWAPDPESRISVNWVKTQGLTFEVAEAGEGDHLALCLHGFPELNYSWRHQMPRLAEMGYRVWAPNLRGYGATDRPAAMRDYTLDKLTQDVADLIDASGVKKVTLFAHDWGGAIAWMFAIQKLRRLERLVVMNLPHPKVFQREAKKWRQIKRSWYIYFFQLPWLAEMLLGRKNGTAIGQLFEKTSSSPERFGPDVQRIYNEASARPGALNAMINYYRALRYTNAEALGDGRVDIPTLLIWGEEDIALGIHCTQGAEEWVHDLTLKRLPGVSHWVQQDAPEEVNAILTDWLPKV